LQDIMKITRHNRHKNKLSFDVVFNLIFNSLLLFFYNALIIYSAHYKII
jgi:hypothetical protein